MLHASSHSSVTSFPTGCSKSCEDDMSQQAEHIRKAPDSSNSSTDQSSIRTDHVKQFFLEFFSPQPHTSRYITLATILPGILWEFSPWLQGELNFFQGTSLRCSDHLIQASPWLWMNCWSSNLGWFLLNEEHPSQCLRRTRWVVRIQLYVSVIREDFWWQGA